MAGWKWKDELQLRYMLEHDGKLPPRLTMPRIAKTGAVAIILGVGLAGGLNTLDYMGQRINENALENNDRLSESGACKDELVAMQDYYSYIAAQAVSPDVKDNYLKRADQYGESAILAMQYDTPCTPQDPTRALNLTPGFDVATLEKQKLCEARLIQAIVPHVPAGSEQDMRNVVLQLQADLARQYNVPCP